MQLVNGRVTMIFPAVLLATVVGVVICIVAGFPGKVAQAREGAPEPQVNVIEINGNNASSVVTVTYPSPATISVRATNVATYTGYGVGIYMSFPELDSDGDEHVVDMVNLWTSNDDDDLAYYEHRPGVSSIWYNCDPGYFDKAQQLLIAGYAPSDWEPGEEIGLEVNVAPPPGTYQVYIKVSVAGGVGGSSYYHDPDSGTYTDQQCDYIYRRVITVEGSASRVYLPVVIRRYAPLKVIRGVRTQASACSSASRCDQRLDCLEAAGANVVYYSIYHDGIAYYHSDLMPHRSFDSLAYLVSEAHKRDIEVYALVTSAFLGWPEHPEWNARYNHPYVAHDWLDFTIPEARSFVADVAEELVINYDIDGILLDATRWRNEWIKKANLQSEDITLTVQGISERVRAARPVQITASPSADHGFAVEWWGQEWFYWLEMGYIDYATPLTYVTRKELLSRWLTEWQDAGYLPDRAIPRLSCAWFDPERPKTVAEILDWIDECYDLGAVGMTLWDDRYICGNQALIDALGAGGW